jgi:hypothetical protein
MNKVHVWFCSLGFLLSCGESAPNGPAASSGAAATGGSGPSNAGSGGALAASGGAKAGASGATPGGAAAGGTGPSGGAPPEGGNQAAGGAQAGGSSAAGASGASGGTATEPDVTGPLVPEQGALLGAYIGSGTVASTEGQLGRKWAIQLQYFDWASDFTSFARNEISAGRIPYVTWEPWKVTLDAIASGAQDATIRSRAMSIAGLGGKVMLRFAHEMNGDWYPWDGADNGASAAAPPKYIAAYRHIHDLFTEAGVKNVVWVFCPNVDSVPNEAWNKWESYYPGDEFVDWLGYDGYNWDQDTFASMTSRIYPSLALKRKPILLGETSTHDAEKAPFISAIVPALKSQFPYLKALVWFHVNKENDWRYDSTQASLAAFVSMAKDPYFNP